MTIEYPSGYWLNKDSRKFLSRDYLVEDQSPEDRIQQMTDTFEKYINNKDVAMQFHQYMMAGWYSLATPVWVNYGTDRGLPISCNGSYVKDHMADILEVGAEIGVMSKYGAGTSAYIGALRGRGSSIKMGGVSHGPVHFMEIYETTVNIVSQSNVRRGSCAIYMDIDHPDVKEFLESREEGSPIQKLSIGICITDKWMQEMIEGDADKRKLWMRVIKKRFETGYPYIFFTDTVNRDKAEHYRDYPIYASNLCAEIAQPSSAEWSFVCCLASMNLLHYDQWKNTNAVQVLAMFMDAVIQEYIDKIEQLDSQDRYYMRKALKSAIDNRAIGIGTLGYHSYLQSKMVAFESDAAREINREIHQFVRKQTEIGSRILAEQFGEPTALKGTGLRNGTLMAIAPTTSSSFILGQVSPSIEPLNSNYFVKDLAKIKSTYKNPYLKQLLQERSMDTDEVWDIILKSGGSVQNLFFLTDHERDVFKTFGEISQSEIIIQAADRQKFIDQSQSLNLMIHPDTPIKDVNLLMIQAWELGVKTLYYQRSTNPAQELARNLVVCKSCEI